MTCPRSVRMSFSGRALWRKIFDMGNDLDTDVQPVLDFVAGSFLFFAAAVFVVWLLIAMLAALVAPDDRVWHFFWCTLLLLGPLGVAVALLAQPRHYRDEP
jgi:hypothetical protein